MPKGKRSRRMRKGGLFGWGESSTTSSTAPSSGSSWTSMFSSTPATPATPTASYGQPKRYPSQYPSTQPQQYDPNAPAPYGGRRRRKSKKMRGGYSANISLTQFSDAAPFSGDTARPQAMVGGKTRRNRKQRRSRKHR